MFSHQANTNDIQIEEEDQIAQALEDCIQRFEHQCIKFIIPLQEQIRSATSYQELTEISEPLLKAMDAICTNSIINMKFPNKFEPYLLAVFGEIAHTNVKKITNFYQSLSETNFSAQELVELVNQLVGNLPTQLKILLKHYTENQLPEKNLNDILMSIMKTLSMLTQFAPNISTTCDMTNPQSIANHLIEVRSRVLKIPFFLEWALQHIVELISPEQEMREYFFEGLEQANQEFNTNLYGSLKELQAGIDKLCETRLKVACNWLEMLQ